MEHKALQGCFAQRFPCKNVGSQAMSLETGLLRDEGKKRGENSVMSLSKSIKITSNEINDW